MQARFPREGVRVEGVATRYLRVAESGNEIEFHFCARCGATVCWEQPGNDTLAVAVGAFADPTFPAPRISIYEERRKPWVTITGDDVEHID